MRKRVTLVQRNKPFSTRFVNGWNKLPEEVVEIGSVCEVRAVRRRMVVNA